MKKIYPFLALAVMVSIFTWYGLTHSGGKPEAVITQASQASQAASVYRTQTIPCPVALPSETEGKTVTCGVLTVPENYEQPNGRQVEITYARFHSTSLSPLPDPVFYLSGGPGGSAVTDLDGLSRVAFAPYRQTRDLVMFDQRGTQFSSALGCAPTAFALEKLGNQFEQYVKKIADNNPLTNDRTIAQYAVCAQVLQKHGFDLNQFNTPNNARDAVNLAAALGYKQINLYGISYGTYLAMAIARDYPTVVRSVVLDSTATPNVNKYTEAGQRNVTPVFNLLQDCAAEPACNQAYPNLPATFTRKPSEVLVNNAPTTVKANPDASTTYSAAGPLPTFARVFSDRTCFLQVLYQILLLMIQIGVSIEGGLSDGWRESGDDSRNGGRIKSIDASATSSGGQRANSTAVSAAKQASSFRVARRRNSWARASHAATVVSQI